MRRWMMICASFFVTACGQTEYVYVEQDIPGQFLEPEALPDREPATFREVADLSLVLIEKVRQSNADKACIRAVVDGDSSDKDCGETK